MSSSVWFKFKSQREPTRVTFDGTGIAVFNLKKEIIEISRLGTGADFDLYIYNQDTNEEYDDDTYIIPRSTSVVARRLPAAKPGQGKAARYVKGSMPVTARGPQHRNSPASTQAVSRTGPSKSTPQGDVAQSEQDRIKAMLDMGDAQWQQEKQQMSTASRVPFHGFKQKTNQAPDSVPPPTYTCHRCQQKGHWIQNCPTNDDPNFDGKPKLKRVTGIPKSMLKNVDDIPISQHDDGLTDETRQPTSVMVNADGNRVKAMPDTVSWDQHVEKSQASAAQKTKMELGTKELQDRGLECPIDRRLFVNPMKTPCCGKTYCYECIDTALAESDLVCPNCGTEGVILEDLTRDEGKIAEIQAYRDEKKAEQVKAEKAEAEKAKAEKAEAEKSRSETSTPAAHGKDLSRTSTPNTAASSKKRTAEDELNNDRKAAAPTDMQRSGSNDSNAQQAPKMEAPSASDLDFAKQMDKWANLSNNGTGASTSTSSAAQMFPMNMNMGMSMPPNMPGMPNIPFNPFGPSGAGQSMPALNSMNMGQMPNFPMPNMPGYPQWTMPNNNGMYGGGNMYSGGNQYNMYPNSYPQQQSQSGYYQQYNMNQGQQGTNQTGQYGQQLGGGQYPQSNQQTGNGDDDAYMRRPVNPHRHGRQKKNRPQDYRELG